VEVFVLLVCRFQRPDPEADAAGFRDRARRAVTLLGAQPGCLGVEFARATEAPSRWVLVATFTSAADYRRALSPFAVREHVVPFLSEALTDEPATFERFLGADASGPTEHRGVLDRP